MDIVCPYCRHPIKVKGAKPGRYSPKCVQCGKAFVLTVPDDPTRKMTVSVPRSSAPGSPAKGSPSRDAAAKPSAKPSAPPAPAKAKPRPPARPPAEPAPPVEDDATAAFIPDAAPQPVVEPTLPEDGPDEPQPAAKPATRPATKKKKTAIDLPEQLGGYRVVKELGRGGMGAVYLAEQISLERKVALKVMDPNWASNPVFMARFTREAYAAAQLVHHNIVQVYDIGEDQGISFFSMEFVEGQSLGDLIKKQGKLDPLTALTYTIQAARGLKFAHDRGMIHRDIKPDNLMINDQGLVKVADLGLVKTPEMTPEDDAPVAGEPRPKSIAQTASSQVTMAGTAMGTPAYMSPEQARDAAHVDHRADIYSLGCTFYVMLTGKPPFVGNTVLEVLSQHASKPVVPPDAVVKGVPKQLSQVLLKMVAKKPEERFADMGEVIAALEEFEATQGRVEAALGEEEAALVEAAAREFRSAPAAKMRSLLPWGFFGGCALLALATLCMGWWQVAGAFLALALLTPLFHAAITAVKERTHLYHKTRELIRETTLREWLTVAGGGVLILLLVFLAKLWGFVGAAVFAAGFAFAFWFLFDRKLGGQRQPAVGRVEKMLRALRLKGVEEEELREFLCRHAGEHWEEFYEVLFGYEAKLEARERWGQNDKGQPRPKFAAWREPVFRWLEAKLKARREARDKKHLQAVEQKNLEAQGLDPAQAEARAEFAAEKMVQKAAEFREASKKGALPPAEDLEETTAEGALPELVDVKKLLAIPEEPDEDQPKRRRRTGLLGGLVGGLFGLLFGPRMRFLVGVLLVAECLFWMQMPENAIFPTELPTDLDQGQTAWDRAVDLLTGKDLEPFTVGDMPPRDVAKLLFNSVNPGAAGLILIVSAFVPGTAFGVLMWLAAAVAFLGQYVAAQFLPDLGVVSQWTCLMIGGGIALFALLFGRERDRRT